MGVLDSKNSRSFTPILLFLASLYRTGSLGAVTNELPCLSISLDNGSEFSEFQLLEKDLQTTVYFAEPHKPWQRGTNENTNDILRFFYPKGYDFRTLSQKELQKVVDLINSRPRKCLGWKSPAEIFFDSSVALT